MHARALPSTRRVAQAQQRKAPSTRAPIARTPLRTPPRATTAQDTLASTDGQGQPLRTDLQALMQRFKSFDVDGNGQIDREELRHLLESVDNGSTVMVQHQHWLPESELDRVMQTYDKDGNGHIDFEEFQNLVYDGLLLDGQLAEYEEAFNAVDKSGNGTIGAMELQKLFGQLGNPLSFEKLSDLMLQYDRDESGQIEFGEFLLMFRDQLLDLKEVQNYAATRAAEQKSNAVLDTDEGEINMIFSKQELDEALSKRDKLTVVFAAMTWCRPCKAMQRPAHKLAAHYKDGLKFVKLFGNSNQQTKQIFKDLLKVRATPCFMVYDGTELLYTQTGRNQAKLEAALRSFIAEDKLPADTVYEPEVAAA